MSLLALIFTLNCSAFANVVGVDTQNFNPTNDGLDFVTVHSSKTLAPGLLSLGFFVNYAVNSLPNYENTVTQSRTNFRDSLLSSDTNFGLGVTHNWEVGMSFPALLSQSVKSDVSTYGGQFTSTGVTEFRLMTKLHLLGGQTGGMAVIVSGNFNEIQNDPFVGTGAGPTFNFELAGDVTLAESYALALNAGYRARRPGAAIPGVPIQPLGDEYIASTALSYLVTKWDTKFIGEIFGSYPVHSQQFISDRKSSSAEFLLGIKSDVSSSVSVHFGGGTELVNGTSSPDWRVYTGLNWVLGPVFEKPKPAIARVKKAEPTPESEPVRIALDITDPRANPFTGNPQPREEFVMRDLLFENNSDKVKPEFKDLLQHLAHYLMQPPEFKSLVVEGHTDSVGVAEHNMELSRRRAASIRDILIETGLPAERITAKGYGFTRPVASNGNFQGRSLNRRIEFKIER